MRLRHNIDPDKIDVLPYLADAVALRFAKLIRQRAIHLEFA